MRSWADLFERAGEYGTTVEAVRESLARRRGEETTTGHEQSGDDGGE